ncbi:MAG: radical SAM protein [Chitinophagales bacterium]
MEVFKLAQMATAYSLSLLAYKANGLPRPFSASFVVSNRCNIHCSYCNFPNLHEKELTLAEIDLVFDRLKDAGVKRLGLLGGEPLLRRDILEIIDIARNKDFFISMNTNLLLYNKHKENLQHIDYFFTSIDGTPDKHIANRGKQNFEQILYAIRDLTKRGKKVIAICVITEPDYTSVNYLLDLAARENIQIHFQPECYDTEIVQRTAPVQANIGMAEFWKHLAILKKQGAPISSSLAYLNYIASWTNYGISSLLSEGSRCAAGTGYLFVDSAGVAYPCAFTKGKTTGINLLEHKWQHSFNKATPCNQCIVGPMLEFNLLFNEPIKAISNTLAHV